MNAGRIVAGVLAMAVVVAEADCACMAAGARIHRADRVVGADCSMPCCGHESAVELPQPVNGPVPCKSTCPHCGQLLLHESVSGTDLGLTVVAFDLLPNRDVPLAALCAISCDTDFKSD